MRRPRRPVFALPGRVDNTLSEGPHQLIRDGAVLTTRLEEILREPRAVAGFRFRADDSVRRCKTGGTSEAQATPSPLLSQRQQLLIEHMGSDPTHVDILIERTGLSAQDILQDLTLLVLKGVVRFRIDAAVIRPPRSEQVNIRANKIVVFIARPRGAAK